MVDSKQKGGLLIQYLYLNVTDYIVDMNIVDTDAASYLHNYP